MKKDSDRAFYHLTRPRNVLFFEQWMEPKLEFDNIEVPLDQQPPNEDDEDLVPQSQYHGFGASKIRNREKHTDWLDLGLDELSVRGPGEFDKTVIEPPMFGKGSKDEFIDPRERPAVSRKSSNQMGSSNIQVPGGSTNSPGSGPHSPMTAGTSTVGVTRRFDRGRAPR
ncbi:hypothetical protein AWJ20_1956 [Sugiyamaella lignohabitans]|uniref:Uncharacterized protein n=1 Tax=Sugiyamaella lignohabitans TaxID=796027 RepID=A0A161HKQ2_9ASCO|nr:uncharacterized protein AWJ20_1956 [Sugiyamaella lignohabitans]ANB13657.1 hypothetical protein AWJ20_1956 [Sugiyamaella lignohabitans]